MKNFKLPSLVTIAILTAITVVFWVFFGVYRVFTTQTPPTVTAAISTSISPNLDTKALENIEKRLFLTNDQIGETVIVPNATPTPSIIVTPEVTSTPTATSSPTLTPSITPGGDGVE